MIIHQITSFLLNEKGHVSQRKKLGDQFTSVVGYHKVSNYSKPTKENSIVLCRNYARSSKLQVDMLDLSRHIRYQA